MAVTLNAPFSWSSPSADDAAMLDALQPNILKGHTREFLTLLFVRFLDAGQAASLLSELATEGIIPPMMKSARRHLMEIAEFHASATPGTPYVGVGITAAGYEALHIPEDKRPSDPAFLRGMTHHQTIADLQDPEIDTWEGHFRQEIHAVILVGDQLRPSRDSALAQVREMIAARPSIVILGEQTGTGLHNENGDGIEHFGYVDGRSQPLFFTEDVAGEMLGGDGATTWDPAFGPGRAIVPDPAAPDPALHFGSYFVFRKLEQNVREFKEQEHALALALGLGPSDVARAGAMVVGRFEDGTPVATQFAQGNHSPVPNDFSYDSDPNGGKCPFFAHIRKMNPRGSGGFEDLENERLHIMARRGQTYGVRTDNANDGGWDNKPTGEVGLLFMAFNASLEEQFEFVQKNWGNNAGFPKVPTGASAPGLDMVIGQGARPGIEAPVKWAGSTNAPANALPQTVTMLGGEYFFMPSLPFLQSLGSAAEAA